MIKELTQRLHDEGCSCVIGKGTEVYAYHRRGVADLYDLLVHEPSFLQGAVVADKVVGKAAAALMVLGEIKQLHADVISQPALALLQEYHIEVEVGEVVHHIENRSKSGWCPLETRSYPLRTPKEIFLAIESFMEQMKQNNNS